MNGLSLFSGIGGIDIALKPWVRTVAYCENERYAQAVLFNRMRSGELDAAPIWDDVVTLSGLRLPQVDIIFGGFPCQDISVAGRGAGLAGERSGLFFQVLRLAQEIKPRFIFLENVPAIRTRGASRVSQELAAIGYDCRWDTLSAAEVGAPHLRTRWWLLARLADSGSGRHSRAREGQVEQSRGTETERTSAFTDAFGVQLRDEQGRSCGEGRNGPTIPRNNGTEEPVAHSEGHGRPERRPESAREQGGLGPSRSCSTFNAANWAVEPNVGRVAHGVPARVDRIRGLGNAVVPAQAREAFKRLAGL